ncbi:hypothetical protein VTN96DRAFT_9824 [Rasamsonia emersonii]
MLKNTWTRPPPSRRRLTTNHRRETLGPAGGGTRLAGGGPGWLRIPAAHVRSRSSPQWLTKPASLHRRATDWAGQSPGEAQSYRIIISLSLNPYTSPGADQANRPS